MLALGTLRRGPGRADGNTCRSGLVASSQESLMSETEDLPEPHEGMTPKEKGELLLRYVQTRRPVDGLRFHGARLQQVELVNSNLKGARLDGADLSGSNLTGAKLEGVRLRNALLRRTNLSGADLRETDLGGADLSGAGMGGARLVRTDLRWATIAGVDFTESYIWGVKLEGADGLPRDRRAAHVDAATYLKSCWTPAHLTEWLRAGAVVESFADFPEDAQLAVFREFEGLLLFLSTRLLPWDQTILHAFACSVLGRDTDVRVADYVETETGCRVRLVGSDPGDLIRFAEYLAQVAWRTEQNSALQAADLLQVGQVLDTLDFVRQHVEKLELWAERSGTQEMLEDHAAVHIKKKDVALIRTWQQKVLKALWGAAKKKMGKEAAGSVEDAMRGLLPGGREDLDGV